MTTSHTRTLGFLCLMGLLLHMPLSCQAKPQVFVRLGPFYLLYTAPVVPYLSRHNTLMVGLAGMEACLYYPNPNPDHPTPPFRKGEWAYALTMTKPATHMATLTFDGHTLVFHAGSDVVVVDGQDTPMPERAVWVPKFGQMVVPVMAVVHGLGLISSWEAKQRTLSITPVIEGVPSESYEAFQMQVSGHESDVLMPTAVHGHELGIERREQEDSGLNLKDVGTLSVTVESTTSWEDLPPPRPSAWFMAQVIYPKTGRTGLFTVYSTDSKRSQVMPLETGGRIARDSLPICVVGWCVERYSVPPDFHMPN